MPWLVRMLFDYMIKSNHYSRNLKLTILLCYLIFCGFVELFFFSIVLYPNWHKSEHLFGQIVKKISFGLLFYLTIGK